MGRSSIGSGHQPASKAAHRLDRLLRRTMKRETGGVAMASPAQAPAPPPRRRPLPASAGFL